MVAEIDRANQARLDFAGGLMCYNSTGIGKAMAAYYESHSSRFGDRKPEMAEVAELMEDSAIYRFGAFFERYNHAEIFQSSLGILEPQRDASMPGWTTSILRTLSGR